jgi:hypothetical protein
MYMGEPGTTELATLIATDFDIEGLVTEVAVTVATNAFGTIAGAL